MRSTVEMFRVQRGVYIVGLLVLGLALFAAPVRAATFTVTTTADSGAGSLRQAIVDANATPGRDTPIASHTTASDGSFTEQPITGGEYRVEMTIPNLSLTRIAVVPASGGIPWVQFPLPPNDTRSRAIVFVDSNQDSQLNSGEQRLGGVNVELFSQPCGGIAAAIETKSTNTDGLALFSNPLNVQAAAAAPGNPPGCVKIVAGTLPPNMAPANLNDAAMPKNSGAPVLLPVYPQGTLLVQLFWDVDGDGAHDGNETFLSSGAATVRRADQERQRKWGQPLSCQRATTA